MKWILAKNQSSELTMEELLASQTQKIINLYKGMEIEGEVVSLNEKEATLDLGAKSEGVLPLREVKTEVLKIGDKIKVFVIETESENGQAILSIFPPMIKSSTRGRRGISLDKFIQAQRQKSSLSGRILEINKGGIMVEVEGVRGFLPNSQIGLDIFSKFASGEKDLIGANVQVNVIEVESNNNRVIFSQRSKIPEIISEDLKKYKNGDKIKGKVLAILPFGLIVEVEKVYGFIFTSDIAWERVEDPASLFSVGDEVEAIVTNADMELGRLTLSIKQALEDPFTKIAQKYQSDDTVKAEVVSVSDSGVIFKIDEGVEGFLPSAKMQSGETYEIGKQMSLLVDTVDAQRRKINLSPMVTSTEGLIYK